MCSIAANSIGGDCRQCLCTHVSHLTLQTNDREYLGRQLDDAIVQRASRLDVLRPTIRSHIEQIQRDLQLLERLTRGDAFELIEKVRLEELGYGSAM